MTVFPIGPQHPALLEPFSVKVDTEGEKVKGIEIRLGYAHRGIEKLFEDMEFYRAIPLAERICGICSGAHTICCSQIFENCLNLEISDRAKCIRTIIAELERIHSHLLFAGELMHIIGFKTFFMFFWKIREYVLDVLETISGNRINYSMSVIGGVRRDIDEKIAKITLNCLDKIENKVREYIKECESDKLIKLRTEDIGSLSKSEAKKYCCVGPVARASSLEIDVRKDIPYAFYENIDFDIVVFDEGDVKARLLARLYEILESIEIIRQAIRNMPEGNIKTRFPWKLNEGEFVACVEAPRGELFYYLLSKGGLKPYRMRVRTPTYANISSLEVMLQDANIADVPVIIASIDPCISCLDR